MFGTRICVAQRTRGWRKIRWGGIGQCRSREHEGWIGRSNLGEMACSCIPQGTRLGSHVIARCYVCS
jgi:hypothetical protein